MKSKIFLLYLIFSLFSANTFAKHIIGGIITYEYTDNGIYRFTMKIYRDCNGGGAVLDGDTDVQVNHKVLILRFMKKLVAHLYAEMT
jgi:hypothetical protein